jgi:hypothetical protein
LLPFGSPFQQMHKQWLPIGVEEKHT